MRWINFSVLAFVLLAACSGRDTVNNEPIICLTIDDGDKSIYTAAYPILKEYGYTATTFVNTGKIGRSNHLSWNDLLNLKEDDWETGGHTVNHANLPDLDDAEALWEITADYDSLCAHGFDPLSFALPSGHATQRDFCIIAGLYRNIRNSRDMTHHQPIDRLNIGYFFVQSDYAVDDIFNRIWQGTINNEALIVIGFHRFRNQADGYPANCSPEVFEQFVSKLREHDFNVMTFNNAVDKLTGANMNRNLPDITGLEP
ncbi:MAG: polysaccharide deacetylase family protein [Candidatus Cloacimonetes bacterium]|nr:polysaccharide deacetylase family protein [Candidatus Cloacimonadota bacterium]